jgi:maleylacetoacetate isomerase
MKLYGYFRSSAAFRVRIALNLKNLDRETALVNLQAGDQMSPRYRAINPQGRVPALEVEDTVLLQSLAIIEYLEEAFPQPPFLPADRLGRARVRGLANIIACDIHPLNNLAVLLFLKDRLDIDEERRTLWYRHWVAQGFDGIEPLLRDSEATGRFCHGDVPGLADICLVPQVFNAQRFGCDLSPYPTIGRIVDECMALEAFDLAQPAKQPEAAELA